MGIKEQETTETNRIYCNNSVQVKHRVAVSSMSEIF